MRGVVCVVLVACGGSPTQPMPLPPAPPPSTLAFAQTSWPELGLAFTSFANTAVDKTPWPAGGVAIQAIVVGDRDRVSWVLRTAPDESMQGFDDDHQGWTRSEGPALTVCGQTVPVAVATHAAEDIECVITATDSHPDHIAPRAAYAVAIRHRGMPLIAHVEIEANDVERWRPIALAMLGSLRCR